MRGIIRIFEKVVTWLSGHLQALLVFCMMVVVMVDVLSRYVLRDPFSIAEEFGGYLLVAVTCMGLAFTWQKDSHVRVEFLIDKLPPKPRLWLRVAIIALALIVSLCTAYAGWELLGFSFMFGTRSGSWVRTPIAYPQMAIFIGVAMLILQQVVDLSRALRLATGKSTEGF